VWENVPGVLSDDDGQTIAAIIRLLTEIGYVCDIDIRDAQYFGVPQRRRRVFITGVLLDSLRKRTPAVERIFGELLAQAFLATWDAALECPAARQKMCSLDTLLGGSTVTSLLDFWQMPGVDAWGENTEWVRLWLTLTHTTLPVRDSDLSMFTAFALDVAGHLVEVHQPAGWTRDHWSLAHTLLTLLEKIIEYARSTGSDLFRSSELRAGWRNNLDTARRCRDDVVRRIAGWADPAEILSFAESLRGHPATGGTPGEDIAAPIMGGSQGGERRPGGQADDAGSLIADIVGTLQSGETPNGHGTAGINRQAAAAGYVIPVLAKALCSTDGGIDREDRHTLIPILADPITVSEGRTYTHEGNMFRTHNLLAGCLQERDYKGIDSDTKPGHLIIDPALDVAVRRLTPIECARLMGVPDDYLDIEYRGRPAADGNKYRALGNAFCVPVMQWVGARLQALEDAT